MYSVLINLIPCQTSKIVVFLYKMDRSKVASTCKLQARVAFLPKNKIYVSCARLLKMVVALTLVCQRTYNHIGARITKSMYNPRNTVRVVLFRMCKILVVASRHL